MHYRADESAWNGLNLSIFRLLIVDDHPIVLTGLKLLFDGDRRFQLSGEATTAPGARVAAERLQPDAIITDLIMGQEDGIALIEDFSAMLPAARIIVYSSCDEAVWAPRTSAAGAHGYVAKSEPLDAVAEAVAAALIGSVSDPQPGHEARRRDRRTDVGDLSAREFQVLQLIGAGGTLQSLASELRLSVKTVGTYRERLKVKLGLDNVRMLERFAADHLAGRIEQP